MRVMLTDHSVIEMDLRVRHPDRETCAAVVPKRMRDRILAVSWNNYWEEANAMSWASRPTIFWWNREWWPCE